MQPKGNEYPRKTGVCEPRESECVSLKRAARICQGIKKLHVIRFRRQEYGDGIAVLVASDSLAVWY